ncbi:hypothetical protein [Pedobacter sp.]|uniref:hypothetical protein n=1 Tax=Pedobacter sp. TaxID=1411316 RepID=UPI00396C95D0
MKITRGELSTLSAIIGKCTIKSIGSELFFPVIKLKAALSVNVTESQSLLKSIYEECGITEDNYKILSDSQGKELMASEKKLNEDVVDFSDTHLLNADQFLLFSDENPKLNTAELEFLYKWLVGVK